MAIGGRGLTLFVKQVLTAFFVAAPTFTAAALDEKPADWDSLKACEKELCELILSPKPEGKDLKCTLAKTWAKKSLKKGESKMVKWGFGDARCLVDLKVERDGLVSALTQPAYALEVPEHNVDCEVEREGEVQKVKAKLAPRIEFKKGRADKVWINLKDIDGPSAISTTIWAAANLEDSLGIFHKSMIKSINKFVHKQCAERYGPNAKVEEANAKEQSANEGANKKPIKAATASHSAKTPADKVQTEPAEPANTVKDAAAK
jgi:hypothetical protein